MKKYKQTVTYYPGFFKGKKNQYEFEELSNRVIGAAISVHKELGPGFLEGIYEEALKILLTENGMSFEKQKEVTIVFHGIEVGVHRLDLVVENQIIVELKAVKELLDIHKAQLRSYLQATGLKIGLLINFARPTLQIKRLVN
jgi:GxxExxY protein